MTTRSRAGYPLAVALVVLGLCPYVVVTTAFAPLADLVARDLHASAQAVQLAGGLGNAAYAVGAVVAAQLGQRFVQRRLFLVYTPVIVVATLVAGLAGDGLVFTIGRTAEGFAAGAMLISSLPVLLTRFGSGRVPVSAAVVNVGMFGASALGPVVGGLVAGTEDWRAFFVVVAVLEALAWGAALAGFVRFDPPDPERPFDVQAVFWVVVATTLLFTGTSLLTGHAFVSWPVLLPLAGGLVALALLFVVEERQEQPLIPLRELASQLPVTGTMAAMVGGAVFVGALQLVQLEQADVVRRGPEAVAWLFWPTPIGAVVAAVLLGVLVRTAYLPLLVDAGLLALAAAPALLLALGSGRPVVLVAAALLGFGAGATVSPGLFLTGFGLPATQLGRAFAMVQLLRSLATYAVAPVVLHLAQSRGDLAAGVDDALVVLLVLAAVGLAAAVLLPFFSGARLRRPDLEGWLDGGQALPSPTLAVHLRPGTEDDDAAPLLPGGEPP
ncbi:MFS transporter [Nocardioides anomalus]|uniref:MFS transporter n=1 Tax=Nocardioides anomalus TaxID=2712223 RepID=A0A6G6WCP3_9ACTN|nr:MFS transporter [Nocardioides anomalus]QIG42810.1 MFS transporter [Nocardioides anomalus]